jgi:hypothetical protein
MVIQAQSAICRLVPSDVSLSTPHPEPTPSTFQNPVAKMDLALKNSGKHSSRGENASGVQKSRQALES